MRMVFLSAALAAPAFAAQAAPAALYSLTPIVVNGSSNVAAAAVNGSGVLTGRYFSDE